MVTQSVEATTKGQGGGRRVLRRAGWNLVDQLISAATNAALSFLVARSVDARGFGAFAVGFLIVTVMIGVGRAVAGQPLTIRHSVPAGRVPGGHRDAAAAGLGAIVLVSVPVAGVCLLVGGALAGSALARGTLGPTLLAFGLVLTPLIVQDGCRMALFARSRPELAALNDALWAAVQFCGLLALIRTGHASAASCTLVWGGSASICAVVGLWQLGVRPRVSAASAWLREHRELAGFLVAQFLLGAGALQGGLLILGGVLGIGNLGALRAAQVLTGPIGVLFAAAMTFCLPEVSRRVGLSPRVRLRIAAGISTSMLTVAVIYSSALMLIPQRLGLALLGDTWAGAHRVLLPVSLVSAFAGACLGPVIVILAAGRTRATFTLTVVEAVSVPTALLLGAELSGAVGAAWGLCLQQALLVPLWFLQLRHQVSK